VRERRSYLVLTLVCAGWGTIPLVVRHVPISAIGIAFSRVSIAAVGLGIALALGADAGGRPLYSWKPLRCVATGALLGVHWAALFAAYKRAPAGTVILVVYLAPVGIALVAPRALAEHVGRRTVVALTLAVAGSVVMARPAVHAAGRTGLLLAVFTAVTFVALVVVSKPLADAYGGLRLAFMEVAVAAITLLPWAARATWGPLRWSWLLLLVLGLVHTALFVGLYLGALARVPATHVGIMGYLEPVGVLLVGWLFLHEHPSIGTLAGGFLILAAGALLIRTAGTVEVPIVVRN
jgi:drug/metabolite transporter (DMT)-like permease